MKTTFKTLAMATLMAGTTLSPAYAKEVTIGVTMSAFDDNFRTLLRRGVERYADDVGVKLQVEDAKNELGLQLNQIQNFIASGVDAIIVNAVDSNATMGITDEAQAAGIPLVYLNMEPINLQLLPDNQAYVGSIEAEAGKLQAEEVCRQLNGQGNAVIIMGDLVHFAALERTRIVHEVFDSNPNCQGMKIVEEQSGKWMRTEASDLVTNWISAGIDFDAVITNHDEMAIGAIQAMDAVGRDMKDVVVAGIDATADAIQAMEVGELDVTVYQDAFSQGKGAVDTALALIDKKNVPNAVWVPFKLVTPQNLDEFKGKN